MKITLSKISEMTGVSCSTISRVLTGNGYVKPETKSLVEKALKNSGYKYKPSKKKLVSAFKKVVLVICGDITNNVYTGYIAGMNSIFEKNVNRKHGL